MNGEQPAANPPMHCQVCGRQLRTVESRRRGRGPVCDEKVNPARGRDHSPTRLRTGRRPSAGPRRGHADPAEGEPSLLDELPEAES